MLGPYRHADAPVSIRNFQMRKDTSFFCRSLARCRKSSAVRIAAFALLVLLVSTQWSNAQEPVTRNEFWLEIDVYIPCEAEGQALLTRHRKQNRLRMESFALRGDLTHKSEPTLITFGTIILSSALVTVTELPSVTLMILLRSTE